MAVEQVGTPTANGTFPPLTADVTIAGPTGFAVGDLLVWPVVDAPFSTLVEGGIFTPTDWTRAVDNGPFTSGQRNIIAAVFWKIADAADVLAGFFTASGHGTGTGQAVSLGCFMVAYLAGTFDPENPIAGFSVNGGDAGPATITALEVDVPRAGSIQLCILNTWESDRGPVTDMTEIANFGGNGGALDSELVEAGPSGDRTCASSVTETWSAIMLVIQPPTDGGLLLA